MIKNQLTGNLVKRKYYLLKILSLVITAYVFLTLNSITTSAQNNISKSPTLENFLKQIEKEYVPQQWKSQLNWGMDSVAKVVPYFYAQIVGYAMFNQKKYLNQNSTDSDIFNKLNEEIISMIPKIANEYNSANKNSVNFEYQNPDWLKQHYINSSNGGLDQEFRQSYKKHAGKEIAQINFSYVFDNEPEPLYKKGAKKDDAIVLLGEEVLPESSRKDLGEPIVNGLKCPLKSDKNFKIDTNDNPNDETCIWCLYNNDLLSAQEPYVNGYKHGEYFSYYVWDNRPRHLLQHGVYNNGKEQGIWEEYTYYEESGVVLDSKVTYNNGIRTYLEGYKLNDSRRDVYLSYIFLFKEGEDEYSEYKSFYENKRMKLKGHYVDGKLVKDECWEEDGTPIPCPSFW